MKKFIFRLMKFFLPFIILGCGIIFLEFYIFSRPSMFKLKANYFKENKGNIDVLILGSSHNMDAINPEYVTDFNLSNLAVGGSDIIIDSGVFEYAIKQSSKLKFAVFPLSYHTIENGHNPKNVLHCRYLRHHNLNLFGREESIIDYSLLLSNPEIFKMYLSINSEGKKKVSLNKYGYATKIPFYEIDRFKNLNYDENFILNDTSNIFITRHKYEDIESYYRNTKTMDYMINTCIQNNIIPIMISTPVYKSYYESYLPSKENRRRKYINHFIKKYPSSIFLDYEQDSRFKVTDFKNEDHLNPKGAEKFSKTLNDTLLAIKSQMHNRILQNK
ncbi:MAG: hypothetical protein COA67_00685 [Lutibacter sp.]|nr:MAG: hypothetical protein COA67_00685 [Lutibacter sp.]